jgi:nitrate reductase gamma subunit
MVQAVLLGWVWLGLIVFVLGCAWRAWRYLRAPVHLRWDLYPVAHEPRPLGGSYLEEKEWWTKPRHQSQLRALLYMAEEILLLAGVFKHNRRVWMGSFPFHWGLYLMVATTVALTAAALGLLPASLLPLLGLAGEVGGALLMLGALVLVALRTTEPKLKPYTTPLDLLNLALLIVLGGLSVAVAAQGMTPVVAATHALLKLEAPQASLLLGLQMSVAALFLFYLPMTRMVHFVAKYFTYHSVRWDDRPRVTGSSLDRSLAAALSFGVSWSASHLQTGKTWAEVATTLPAEVEKGK